MRRNNGDQGRRIVDPYDNPSAMANQCPTCRINQFWLLSSLSPSQTHKGFAKKKSACSKWKGIFYPYPVSWLSPHPFHLNPHPYTTFQKMLSDKHLIVSQCPLGETLPMERPRCWISITTTKLTNHINLSYAVIFSFCRSNPHYVQWSLHPCRYV